MRALLLMGKVLTSAFKTREALILARIANPSYQDPTRRPKILGLVLRTQTVMSLKTA